MATVIRAEGRMGKGAFVYGHAELHGLTKSDSLAEVTRVFETLFASVAGGNSLNINNFGTFQIVEVESRDIEGRERGELTRVRAHRRLTLAVAPRLHNVINNYKDEPMTARKLAKGERDLMELGDDARVLFELVEVEETDDTE